MRKSADSFTIVIRLVRTREVTGETPRLLSSRKGLVSQTYLYLISRQRSRGWYRPSLPPFLTPEVIRNSEGVLE